MRLIGGSPRSVSITPMRSSPTINRRTRCGGKRFRGRTGSNSRKSRRHQSLQLFISIRNRPASRTNRQQIRATLKDELGTTTLPPCR